MSICQSNVVPYRVTSGYHRYEQTKQELPSEAQLCVARIRPLHLTRDCSSAARISNNSPYPERSEGDRSCVAHDGDAFFPVITAFRQRFTQPINFVPSRAMFVGWRSISRSNSPLHTHRCF